MAGWSERQGISVRRPREVRREVEQEQRKSFARARQQTAEHRSDLGSGQGSRIWRAAAAVLLLGPAVCATIGSVFRGSTRFVLGRCSA